MRRILALVMACSAAITLAMPADCDTLTVNSRALDGSAAPDLQVYTASTSGLCRITVCGVYQYDLPGYPNYWADAGWATWDNWATLRPEVDGSPVQDHPGDPFRYDVPAGVLMLWMNDGQSDYHEWGDYSPQHEYSIAYYVTSGQQLRFWVCDWYPYGNPACYLDNAGYLTVQITPVPEPTSVLALLCGIFGVSGGALRRRLGRKRQS